jgi:hypothetical protein
MKITGAQTAVPHLDTYRATAKTKYSRLPQKPNRTLSEKSESVIK